MAEANPILDNPCEEPARHYATNPEGELDSEGEEIDQVELFEEFRRGSAMSPAELADMLASGELDGLPEDFDMDKASEQFSREFAKFAQAKLLASRLRRSHLLRQVDQFLDHLRRFDRAILVLAD